MAHQFQFVNVSDPTKPTSSESRKSTHSHLMRQAHARKRRLQMQRYRYESVNRVTNQDQNAFKPFLSSPLSQVLTNTKDPFSSLARPLSSVEYFLLNHFPGPSINHTRNFLRSDISNSIPDIQVVMPYSVGHCGLFDSPGDHQRQMLREWVGLAITDDALMVAAILLSTCRYILLDRPDHPIFTRIALQYKQICLCALRREIGTVSLPVEAMTIAKALALAVDEVNSGEYGIARKHLQGVFVMIQFSGGPKALGLTEVLERMYHRFNMSLGLGDTEVD